MQSKRQGNYSHNRRKKAVINLHFASAKLIMAKKVYDKKMSSGSISFSARWWLSLDLVATDLTHRFYPQALQLTGSNVSVVRIMFASSTIVAAAIKSTNAGKSCDFLDRVVPPQAIVGVNVRG